MKEYIIKHKEGIIGTILFHMMVLAFILSFGLTTPLPLPAEEGILLDFGDSKIGMGENLQESTVTPKVLPSPAPIPVEKIEEEQNMTQDFEEAPVIEQKKEVVEKKKEDTPKPVEQPKQEEVIEPVKEEPVVEVRKANQNALFPGNTNSTSTQNSNQGDSNQEGGNKGVQDGEVGVNNYDGTQSGGGGVSFSLNGRTRVNLPKPNYNINEGGIVVVQISVNREGVVTSAVPGVKGSTTLNEALLNAAKKAALNARFNRKPDAAATQSGTITYVFKLQ